MPEQAEALGTSAGILNLSKEIGRSQLTSEIEVRGEDLGAGVWEQMLERTRVTSREYGLTVWSGKRPKPTEIIEGSGVIIDSDTGEKFSPRVEPSATKDYLKGFFRKKIAFVHTHPDEDEGDPPLKSRFSRSDIKAYINGGAPAMVMLDNEGVHVLLRPDAKQVLEASKVAESAYENVSQDSQTSPEIRTSIAQSLASYGISYYFSPHATQSPDGVVRLKDVRTH